MQLHVGVVNPNQTRELFLDESISFYVDDITMVPYEAFEEEIYTRDFNKEEAKKLGEDNNQIQAIKAGTDSGAFDGTNFFDLEMKAGAANSWPFLTIDGFGSPAGEVVFEGMFNTTYTGDKTDRLAELHYGFQMPGSDVIARVILSRINKDSVMDHANKPVASNTPGQWLKIKVTIHTYKGTYQISVYDKDGALLGENKAQNMPKPTAPANDPDRYKNFSYAKASAVDARYMTASDVGAMHLSIDNLKITKVGQKPTAPVVSDVVLSGRAVEEQKLKVTYKYLDDNGDPEDTGKTEINWYRADSADAADWGSAVATGSEYVLTSADIGKYIKATVKTYAIQPPEESNLVETEVIGPVKAKPQLDKEKITTLDLTKTPSMLMSDAADAAMTVFGSSENGEYELTDSGRMTYESSDEYVLTVANDGKISIKNPGYAIVTGTYTNPDSSTVSAKIVLNIAKDTPKLEGFESYTIPSPELNTHLTLVEDPVRTGKYAMAYRTKPASGSTTANWGLDSYASYSNPSAIGEVWFYDSGEKGNAKASAYFQSHDRDLAGNAFPNNMAVRIGTLDDSKDYYMYSNSVASRKNVGPGAENYTGTDKEGTGYLGDKYTNGNVLLDGKNGTPAVPRSKGWHQAVMVVNGGTDRSRVGTDQGTITLFLDGVEIYTERYVPLYLNVLRGENHYGAASGISSYYDDLNFCRYYPQERAPVARDVKLSGTTMVDGVLTVTADIFDENFDPLAASTYQWQRADKADAAEGEWTNIAGATGESYTCTADDLNKFIRVLVTPHSTVDPKDGEPTASDVSRQIASKKNPPSAANVSLTGTPAIGNKLTVNYTYTPAADGDTEGDTVVRWERSEDQQTWTEIEGATGTSYGISVADAGKYIRATVIPTDKNGLTGAPVTAPEILQIGNEVSYFVATDGDDNNPGTIDAPFKTVEKARDTIRAAKGSLPVGQITINIRGGEYPMSQAVKFDQNDSGTEQSPIVYQAYNDEKVVFIGGKVIDNDKLSKVTDQAILSRVIDPFARDRLMQLDLSDIDTIPAITDYGMGISGAAYTPLEVYFDGTALTQSRWPNDEPGMGYLRTGNYVQIGDGKDDTKYKEVPFTIDYVDPTNRAATYWSEEAKDDLYITGFVANDWAGVTHKIASMDYDQKRITSVNGTSYKPQANHRLYFWNLIEEIDMPGESYIDRENKVVYFYPANDVANAEIMVSTMTDTMFQLDKVSYVTLKGLEFGYTRNNAINVSNGSHVTIDGVTVAHTSNSAMSVSGTNCVVKNSHVFDTGAGGISISGGDRKTLVSANNVVENNRVHSVNRVYNAYKPAISVSGVGARVRNNEIYDGPHEMVTLGGNDLYFEYNEVYNAVLDASDMGAVYWGRNPTNAGYELNYNYFHHIGNAYGGYGQQSVFWDDGATGPYMKGNIFYRGTLTTDQGGNTGRCYPVKTNGGQYSVLENNIFVDAPTAVWFQPWNTTGSTVQDRWWLWVHDSYSGTNHNIWKLMRDVGFDSDTWKEHYAGTQWEWLNETFTQEQYEEVHALFVAGNTAKLDEIAKDRAPSNTNTFRNNIAVKVDVNKGGEPFNGNGVGTGTYRADTDILPSGNSMFVEYGEDFKLTEEGLAAVNAKMNGAFENIPTEKIGLMPYTDNGQEKLVGGLEPTASNAVVGGNVSVGSVISAIYNYTDPDGDPESVSEIVWYMSDSENGKFERIPGKQGKELFIDESYADKYIRYELVPYDSYMRYGEAVVSETVQVGKEESPAKKLEAKIREAEALNSVIAEGSLYGQAPAGAKNAFGAAIEAAKAVTSTDAAVLSEALSTLQGAIDAFQAAVNTTVPAIESGATYDIPPFVDVTNITIPADKSGVKVTVPAGMELGEINISGTITVDGEARAISLKIPAGTRVEGTAGSRVALSVFASGGTPSQTVNNAEKITAVAFGGDLSFSGPVRIEIEGAYSKRTGHIIGGRYTAVSTTIKADTAEAAQSGLKNRDMVRVSNTAPKLVVWADGLNELVLYDNVTNVTPTPAPPIGGGGSGSNNPGNSNGGGTTIGGGSGLLGGGGSKFIDINNHWAKSDIEAMYSKGIVAGVTENIFEPDRPVTRAEFAALVARALNLTAAADGQEWKDVSSEAWYAPVVNAAANAGIIAGYDGWYRPDDLITREEMAVIIAKAYAFKGGVPKSGAIEMFADRDEISEWAYGYVDTAAAIGILKGMTPTTFVAAANTTRAEATSVLKRLLDLF